MVKTIVAIFLILHGLVHGILAMAPNPVAPNERKWLRPSRDVTTDDVGLR